MCMASMRESRDRAISSQHTYTSTMTCTAVPRVWHFGIAYCNFVALYVHRKRPADVGNIPIYRTFLNLILNLQVPTAQLLGLLSKFLLRSHCVQTPRPVW